VCCLDDAASLQATLRWRAVSATSGRRPSCWRCSPATAPLRTSRAGPRRSRAAAVQPLPLVINPESRCTRASSAGRCGDAVAGRARPPRAKSRGSTREDLLRLEAAGGRGISKRQHRRRSNLPGNVAGADPRLSAGGSLAGVRQQLPRRAVAGTAAGFAA
jgi:hypothetical protein